MIFISIVGSSHMKTFALNSIVQKAFLQCATTFDGTSSYTPPLQIKLKLPNCPLEELTYNTLAKLVIRVLNPLRKFIVL